MLIYEKYFQHYLALSINIYEALNKHILILAKM